MGLAMDIFKEVNTSTLPIAIVLLILQIVVLDSEVEELALFIFCIFLVIVGFATFLYGVQSGINPTVKAVGAEIPKRKSHVFMIVVVFMISFLVTVAEPNVAVFSEQVHSIFSTIDVQTLTYAIAIGVAVFLIIAALRIIYDLSLRLIIMASYAIIIVLVFLTPVEFLGIAFDAGSVTTGPMTIPILLSLGIGICSVGGSRTEMDGFGMIGLASIGPVITLLIMGILSGDSMSVAVTAEENTMVLGMELLKSEFINAASGVVVALVPLIIFFAFFQRVFLMYSWTAVKNMAKGVGTAGLGVIIFLTGIYSGFMPASINLGGQLYDSNWLVPLGFLLGFLVVISEPAMHILGRQVEASSQGLLPSRLIFTVISLGVSLFVAIAMAKIIFDIPFVWIIVPGYILAMVLMYFGDHDMTGISFDAGGVATGPMSVAILLSMYTGLASAKYTGMEAVINGFGIIALIALAPIIFLSVLGIVNKLKKEKEEIIDESNF
ncbi:MAG: DUF1538 domain-containing protein [Candidatus Methanomethylophilaceae archaeon]